MPPCSLWFMFVCPYICHQDTDKFYHLSDVSSFLPVTVPGLIHSRFHPNSNSIRCLIQNLVRLIHCSAYMVWNPWTDLGAATCMLITSQFIFTSYMYVSLVNMHPMWLSSKAKFLWFAICMQPLASSSISNHCAKTIIPSDCYNLIFHLDAEQR